LAGLMTNRFAVRRRISCVLTRTIKSNFNKSLQHLHFANAPSKQYGLPFGFPV
jgi:hypothetical protein